MGSYATVADIQALIPELTIGATSQPSSSEVEAFITQIEAAINGVLSAQGYSAVPATGANDVLLLRGYVSTKVAALAWLVAFLADEAPAKVVMWNKDFSEFMNRLRQGQQHLVDQLPQGDSEPVFGVVRHPTRDDFFTERGGVDDWDEA